MSGAKIMSDLVSGNAYAKRHVLFQVRESVRRSVLVFADFTGKRDAGRGADRFTRPQVRYVSRRVRKVSVPESPKRIQEVQRWKVWAGSTERICRSPRMLEYHAEGETNIALIDRLDA